MTNLTVAELAYIAGLFDGEGCVGYYKASKTSLHRPLVSLMNTDFRALRWLQARINFGRVRPRNQHARRIGWEWIVDSKQDVILFLSNIRDYLIIKQDQADLLLSHLNAEQEMKRPKTRKIDQGLLNMRENLENNLKKLKVETHRIQ